VAMWIPLGLVDRWYFTRGIIIHYRVHEDQRLRIMARDNLVRSCNRLLDLLRIRSGFPYRMARVSDPFNVPRAKGSDPDDLGRRKMMSSDGRYKNDMSE